MATFGDPLGQSYLDFLTDGTDLLDGQSFGAILDPATLSAVCVADPAGPPPQPSEATRKRIMEQDSDNSDDDDGKGGSRDGGKRAKGEGTTAARNKATREKARREKINERFAELAALIDPGKEPKTDKPTILADAIKYVTQMRVENHQLKQLNKFLEERVAQFERDRGQALYQHSLMMQQNSMMMPPPMMPGMHMPPPGMPPPGMAPPGMPGTSSIHAPSPQPSMQHIHAAQMAAAAAAAAAAGVPPSHMHPHPHPQGLPSSSGTSGTPLYSPMAMHPMQSAASSDPNSMAAAAAAASVAGPSTSKGQLDMHGHGSGMLPPSMHWVQPQMLDTTQDTLLRPPAA